VVSWFQAFAFKCNLYRPLHDGTYTGNMRAVITAIAPTGNILGLFVADPTGTGMSPATLRCLGAGGACVPPIDIGGVQILYVPPAPIDPLVSLAPPGLETTAGVLSISFKADDGRGLQSSTSTIVHL
jgi:hypothetical protein